MYQHIEKDRKKWDFNAVVAVVAVFLIISLEYYAFMFVFAAHLFNISPGLGGFVYVEIHLFVVIMIWSYYKVITTGPGYLSEGINDTFSNVDEIKERQKLMLRYKYARNHDNPRGDISNASQNTEDLEANPDHQEIRRIASNPILQLQEVGYCFKCKRIKIPRAHHCKQCGKCVLRMDHHCPWTGNCIGLYNHKYFVLFLVYAFSLIFQIFLWQCFVYIPNSMNFKTGITEVENAILQVSLIGSGGLALAIGFLMGFQIYITAKNLTTVEHHIPTITERNPFDKGPTRNFEEVFGTDHSTWIWPLEPRLRSEEDLFLSKSY